MCPAQILNISKQTYKKFNFHGLKIYNIFFKQQNKRKNRAMAGNEVGSFTPLIGFHNSFCGGKP